MHGSIHPNRPMTPDLFCRAETNQGFSDVTDEANIIPAGVRQQFISVAVVKSLKRKCLVAPLLFTFETGSSDKHLDGNSALIGWLVIFNSSMVQDEVSHRACGSLGKTLRLQ